MNSIHGTEPLVMDWLHNKNICWSFSCISLTEQKIYLWGWLWHPLLILFLVMTSPAYPFPGYDIPCLSFSWLWHPLLIIYLIMASPAYHFPGYDIPCWSFSWLWHPLVIIFLNIFNFSWWIPLLIIIFMNIMHWTEPLLSTFMGLVMAFRWS
jgi:hypothetical protein